MDNMKEKMEIICVACPKGCRLEARRLDGEVLVSNEGCKRGIEYAVDEIHDPRRMVASTVRVKGGLHPLVPVFTSEPFPKGRIGELLVELRRLELSAPVAALQVVLPNALGSGIDILASRGLAEKEKQVPD